MAISKFPAGARICCFGDSITRNGDWIETLLCFYAEQKSYPGIQLYNCGISGGGTHTILDHLSEDLACYHPTHAIIMAGMNDIHRELYLPESTMDPNRKERLRAQALDNYRENLKDILYRLGQAGISVVVLSPTPYDEAQCSSQPCMTGCDAALQICTDICRELSQQFGCEILDIHKLFGHVMAADAREIIEDDRIHPSPAGQQLFAKLLLNAQGFSDTSLAQLPGRTSPLQQKRRETERILRDLEDTQLLVFDSMEPLSVEEKHQIARRYLDGYRPYFGYYEDYYTQILTNYVQYIFNKNELLSEYIHLTEQFSTVKGE